MKIFGLSLIWGVVITLLTGLLSNMSAMLVGEVHYGYPVPWLFRLVLAPEYFPWRVNVAALVADVIVWTIVVAVGLLVWTKIKP